MCIILFSRIKYNMSLAISADQSDLTSKTPGGHVIVWRTIMRQHVSNEAGSLVPSLLCVDGAQEPRNEANEAGVDARTRNLLCMALW